MASWPDLTEYHEAVQHPLRAFDDSGLKKSSIELDRFGMPKPATGGNAVVYKASESGETWAIRCFLRPISDHAERYDFIAQHLRKTRLPYSIQFLFLRQGIQIHGEWYPVVKMEWVEGPLLHRYIEENLGQPKVLAGLRRRWRALVGDLEATRIAHGDLQHGNILVREESLRLIDYDGMWVPALKGRAATEIGHRAYQHPRRSESDFGPTLDRFSALVIDLSLLALEREPELWNQYHTGDNLIFVRDDFREPGISAIWQSLTELRCEEIDRMAGALESSLQQRPADVPDLETILKKSKRIKRKAVTAASPEPAPAGIPSWLASGAPSALPILDQAKTWKVVWSRPGERLEVRWKRRPRASTPDDAEVRRAPAPAVVAAAGPRAELGIMGRVAAFLRKDVRQEARPIDADDEPESDRSREEVRTLVPGMSSMVACIQASADGKQLAVVTRSGECGFWNLASDSFKPARSRLPDFEIAAFGAKVPKVVVARSGEASVWDIVAWIRSDCPVDGSNPIRSVALGPGASKVAIGYENSLLQVVELAGRNVVAHQHGQGGPVTALAFSDDGQYLLSGTAAGAVELSRLTPSPEKQPAGFIHTSPIRALAVAPTGQLFASADEQGTVAVWGRDMQRLFSVPLCKIGIGTLCFLGVKDLALAVGCNDGTIKVISVGAGRLVSSFRLGGAPVTALSFASDKPGLAAGTGEGHVGLMAVG